MSPWWALALYPLIGYMCACRHYRNAMDVEEAAIAFWLWPLWILMEAYETSEDALESCFQFPGEFIKKRHKE